MIKRILFTLFVILLLCGAAMFFLKYNRQPKSYKIGEAIDSLNGIKVYYNGNISHISGRSRGSGNYNIGLKYQCVEFVKRYYYEHLNHKMPEPAGDAKDFYDKSVPDGLLNSNRGLIQFSNPGSSKPKEDDLLVFGGTIFNSFGHVAIVSGVSDDALEIIQQNPGPMAGSRVKFALSHKNGKWKIECKNLLGWLRKS
jgi:surface antigen